jgi:hypothetical protein
MEEAAEASMKASEEEFVIPAPRNEQKQTDPDREALAS